MCGTLQFACNLTRLTLLNPAASQLQGFDMLNPCNWVASHDVRPLANGFQLDSDVKPIII
jgi:hypothetical protein